MMGPKEILIVALVLLLMFGASRLSEIGKGLGEGVRNFKKGIQDPSEETPADEESKKHLPESTDPEGPRPGSRTAEPSKESV